MYEKLLAAAAATLIAGSASAMTTIDAEDWGTANMDGLPVNNALACDYNACEIVGTEFSGEGLTLSFTDVPAPGTLDTALKVVRVGTPTDGFVNNDTPEPAGIFGSFFITTEFDDNTHFSMTFDAPAVNLSFDIADIDGSGTNSAGVNQTEAFRVTFFYSDLTTDSVTVFGDDPAAATGNTSLWNGVAGNNLVSRFSSSNVTRVEVLGTTVCTASNSVNCREIGWGLDNIQFSAVPLPAGVWLLGSAFVGLGLTRRRRKS